MSGSAFEFRMRHFENDHLLGLPIKGFEHGRHAASFNERCDDESFVEDLADLEFVAQRPANLREEALRSR